MENCIFLNKLKHNFFASFSMLEKIIDICPNELWNKKLSGFIFWQQIYNFPLYSPKNIHLFITIPFS